MYLVNWKGTIFLFENMGQACLVYKYYSENFVTALQIALHMWYLKKEEYDQLPQAVCQPEDQCLLYSSALHIMYSLVNQFCHCSWCV